VQVLIAGGGIAGPAAAIALSKAGISSVLYEAYPRDTGDAGAFVTISANGQDALRAIDAEQAVVAASFAATRLRVFDPAGSQVADLPLGQDLPGPRTITRARLSRVLREEAARRGVPISYGKRLTTATWSRDGVRTHFADGSHADGDLLVGANGIRSPLRALIDPAAPAPRYTGLMIACGYAENPPAFAGDGGYDMIYGRHPRPVPARRARGPGRAGGLRAAAPRARRAGRRGRKRHRELGAAPARPLGPAARPGHLAARPPHRLGRKSRIP
jgi:2-polyprenyl-6-methoxyphenol hydroxylase-like FAD-dependent oxidoreductase